MEEPSRRQYARRVGEGGEEWLLALAFSSGPKLLLLEDGRVPTRSGRPALINVSPPEILPGWVAEFQERWLRTAMASLDLPDGYEVDLGDPTTEELEAGRAMVGAFLRYLELTEETTEGAGVARDAKVTEGAR